MLGRFRARAAEVRPLLRRVRLTGSIAHAHRFAEIERLSSCGNAVPPTVHRLRVKALGCDVGVRQGTKDYCAVRDTFAGGYHLPPPGMKPDTILDLGANIGMTMAHFAVLYPRARMIGVELDADNAALCRENVRPWADRCTLVEGAVWTADGQVTYERRRGLEQGFHVADERGNAMAPAITLNTLLARHGWDQVDFVKMDIEGAEEEVLRRGTEWAERVRSIKVEVHGSYTVGDCASDLRALGFETRVDDRHWAAVIGQRDSRHAG